MPKSRLGSPFNPVQRYTFLFYAANFLFTFFSIMYVFSLVGFAIRLY